MLRTRLALVAPLAIASVLSAAEPKGELKLSDPKSAMETQVRLILAGDEENVRLCFVPELRDRITKTRLLLAHGELRNTSLASILGRVETTSLEGQEAVDIYSSKGSRVTTLVHSGDTWLGTTLWF